MSKHTPGPWAADLNTYPIMVSSRTETWPLLDELGNEEGRAGAFVANTGDNKANARLIAAAPELLNALVCLMKQSARDAEAYAPNGNEPIWALIADASDAIAKATK